jgi:hypothetical protein
MQNTQNNSYNFINACCNYTTNYFKTINPLTHASSFFGVKPDDIDDLENFKNVFANFDEGSNLGIEISNNVITINGYKFDMSKLSHDFTKKLKNNIKSLIISEDTIDNLLIQGNTSQFKVLSNQGIANLLKEYGVFLAMRNALTKLQKYSENEQIGNYDHIIPDALGTIIAPALSYIKALKTPLSIISILGSIANIAEYGNGLIFNNKKDELYNEVMPELAGKIKESGNNIKSGKVKTTGVKVLSNLAVIAGYAMSLGGYKSQEEKDCLTDYTKKYSSEIANNSCDNYFDLATSLKVGGGLISSALFFLSIYAKSKIGDNHDLQSKEKYDLASDIKECAAEIVLGLNQYDNKRETEENVYNILAKSVFGQFGLGESYPKYDEVKVNDIHGCEITLKMNPYGVNMEESRNKLDNVMKKETKASTLHR